MRKLAILSTASLFMLSSCVKDLTSMNDNTKAAGKVPGETLFSNAEKNYADMMTSPSVNLNIFRVLTQQWTETTYIDESNYDLSTRNIPQGFWNSMYRNVLKDLDESNRILSNDPGVDEGTKTNQLAINDILMVDAFGILVNTFGNIPYSEALDFNNLKPKYDDAATIYADLLRRLDADLAALDPSKGSYPDADLFYGGDIDAWKKYANSLKLKLGMILADADPAKAKAAVESAVAAGVFTSSSDDFIFHYLSAPPNNNPVWADLVQSGRKDWVAANTIVDYMKTVNDPRIPLYFTEDANGDYNGGPYGENNNYATYSKPSATLTAVDYPSALFTYSDVEFLLAEAVERGFTVGGTAEEHYNNAITAAMKYYGVSDADIATYLAQPAVAYATAAGTYKVKIGYQKWIAMYNRGFDAWVEWRRLDAPSLTPPPSALSEIPVRYTYPVAEQNLNTANYNDAASAIGGDKVETKLFWDKF